MRLAIALIMLQLYGGAVAHAQRYMTTFGLVSEMKTPKNTTGILCGDFNGDGGDEIASFGERQISINVRRAMHPQWRGTNLLVDLPIAHAVAARCNSDRFADLIVLTDSIPQLEVLLRKSADKFSLVWKSPVSGSFDNFIAADVNNDKRTDILLFGKKEPGITVYLGRGNGAYHKDALLLPEYSYSAVTVVDVNGDDINDIIATNWISNSLLIFTGFGRMKFSEPVEIRFPHEPSLVAVGHFDTDYNPDLAVGSPEDSACRILLGDGLGEFHEHQTVYHEGALSKIAVADVNGDGRDDICVLSEAGKSWSVDINDGTGMMQDQSVFFAGLLPVAASLARRPGFAYPDAVVMDRALSVIRMYQNSNSPAPQLSERTYAAGLRPDGVLITDLNHDGWNDIIVANGGSREVSLYLNRDSGAIEGMIPIRSSFASSDLRLCMSNDTSAWFGGTNEDADSITVLRIDVHDYSSSSFALPTQGPSEILHVGVDSSTAFLHIFILEHDRASRRALLIEYEQVNSTRFVERAVTPALPLPLLDAAMIDDHDAGYPGVILASYDTRRHKENIYFARGTSGGQFTAARLLLSLDQPEIADVELWSARLNYDSLADLIINVRAPENSLLFCAGKKDSIIGQPYFSIRHSVNITSKENLQLVDVNGDGIPDLVCQNDLPKAIQLYVGNRDGTFSPPVRLAASEGLGSFAVGNLDHDVIPELIMTDKMHGTLKIITLKEQ